MIFGQKKTTPIMTYVNAQLSSGFRISRIMRILLSDLHGLRAEEAVRKARTEVAKSSGSVYIIRLIHGYHGVRS